MNFNQNKFVRFVDLSPERQNFSVDGLIQTSNRPTPSLIWKGIQKGFEKGSERVKSFSNSIRRHHQNNQLVKKNVSEKKKVLDPQGSFLQLWNKIFVGCCVLAVSLDPLFFYIPVIDRDKNCLKLDTKMQTTACVLRTVLDIFYIVHILFQFRTGFIRPSSRVFGRGELVEDSSLIAKRYLFPYFIIDILSILPVPQVVVLYITPKLRGPQVWFTKESLKYIIFIQYIPRFARIHPLYKEVTLTSGIFTELAWVGAAFNLFLYMLASHVLGAFWYFFSIERNERCWRITSKRLNYDYNDLYCGKSQNHVRLVNESCPLVDPDDITNSTVFNFGIFIDALQSTVVETGDFPKKFTYCFWWGLRNLSSLGQNLKTSTYIWENVFAVSIAVFGLLLFALLIGNMQTYLQSTTKRIEEMRVKRRDAEQWMSHRMLPDNLKRRIRKYEQYKWQETRGVEENSLIHSLPKDLRRDIKRHLCLALLMRVPLFEQMDEQLLDAMCDRLKPVLYTEQSYIVREGDPVDEMLFIMRGDLLSMTTNGGRTGFFNSDNLKAGDFCGEEVLTWALDPNSSSNLPSSTRTVRALKEVEAFALMAHDLKFVAAQFRRLYSKQLKHTFKFYSHQWRTWAACFIQAAWRRYYKRKVEKSLREEEDRLQNALAKETETSPSLGAAIYASKFAANALRALRRNGPRSTARVSPRLMPLLPPKPAEPDFSSSK